MLNVCIQSLQGRICICVHVRVLRLTEMLVDISWSYESVRSDDASFEVSWRGRWNEQTRWRGGDGWQLYRAQTGWETESTGQILMNALNWVVVAQDSTVPWRWNAFAGNPAKRSDTELLPLVMRTEIGPSRSRKRVRSVFLKGSLTVHFWMLLPSYSQNKINKYIHPQHTGPKFLTAAVLADATAGCPSHPQKNRLHIAAHWPRFYPTLISAVSCAFCCGWCCQDSREMQTAVILSASID